MRYAPTPEQDDFAQAVRAFLQQHAPESGLAGLPAGTDRFDRGLWNAMAGQLELQGIAAPEHLGGSGFGAVEQGIVAEELGRALVPVPYLASVVLALPLITGADQDGALSSTVRDIVAGRTVAAAALKERGGATGTTPTVRATDGGRLSGTKSPVVDGDLADVFVVSALDADDETGLYLVPADGPGVSVHPHTMLDPTRGGARVDLDAAPATRLDPPGQAARLIADVLTGARVALAYEQLGGAARCLEIAVEHANTREQFGRPIGSFQAVKHMCADVLCDVEAARSAAWYASWAIDASPGELPAVAHTAKYVCSEAYLRAARTCVHVLGGIGFTWEHPAQLFFKRATSDAQLLGSPNDELNRLAGHVLEPVAAGGPA